MVARLRLNVLAAITIASKSLLSEAALLGPRVSVSPVTIGPDSGVPASSPNRWDYNFLNSGALFLILRLRSNIEGTDRVEIELGYDTDVFTAASGDVVYSRPIEGDSVTISYFDVDGDLNGSVELLDYGRGETNDLFLAPTNCPFVEPATIGSYSCPEPPPSWLNTACLGAGTMKTVAESVGMVIFWNTDEVHSCSATLIDPATVLTAGHCIPGFSDKWETDIDGGLVSVNSASFTFDFEANCDNTCPSSYSPEFFKVTGLYKTGLDEVDYAWVKLDPSINALGRTPITMRDDLSGISVDDPVFIIHHPTGRVKKVSNIATDTGSCLIKSISLDHFYHGCDIDHGSSGSSLFDTDGQIIALTIRAASPCGGKSLKISRILEDVTSSVPPSAQDTDVMMVLDVSGSMAASVGSTTKIEELREAATLFIDLLETNATHQAGVVTFSTSASLDYSLKPFNDAAKSDLIGPSSSPIIDGLSPIAKTSIGDGLDEAQNQFDPGSANIPTILLMTDGLQNTRPLVDAIQNQLVGTRICAVGFGSAASLDGELLGVLAADTGGIYTRAQNGLDLKKFFVLCFGNIFQSATSLDPLYEIQAGTDVSSPIPFQVCGESRFDVIIGYSRTYANLDIELTGPNGDLVTTYSVVGSGIESSKGNSYSFLRVSLPLSGNLNDDGEWKAVIRRNRGVEFGFNGVDKFFFTVLLDDGPKIEPADLKRRYYTGDSYDALVQWLPSPSSRVKPSSVLLEVTRPTEGTGNLLAESGIGLEGSNLNGDLIDNRQQALLNLESLLSLDEELIPIEVERHTLCEAPCPGTYGPLEPAGIFGKTLDSLFTHEGTYSFRAIANYGDAACTSQRETAWSVNVGIGIDPDPTKTSVLTTITDATDKTATRVMMVVMPRDRLGNSLGPGRCGSFKAQPKSHTTITGGCWDNLDGTYTFDLLWDQTWDESDPYQPPGFEIVQPDRQYGTEVSVEAEDKDLPDKPPPREICEPFLFFGTTLLHCNSWFFDCYTKCVLDFLVWLFKWFLGFEDGACPLPA